MADAALTTPCGAWLAAQASSLEPSALAYEVVTTLEGLEALVPSWRALLCDAGFFVGPDWVIEWLRWQTGAVEPLAVVARDPSGRVVGLLPLARGRGGEVVVCGADEGAVHVDVVAAPGREAEVAAGALDRLEALRAPRIRLLRLAAEGALALALRARVGARPTLVRAETACPYVVASGDWSAFLRDLSKHQRHELTRQMRRFWERDGAALRWVTTREGVPSAVATLFDLHERRFAAKRKDTVFRGSGLQGFHVALASRLADRGALMLGVLSDGGADVGVAYGFHQGARTMFFQNGIDPAFQATGAGVVLRGHVMKDACLGGGRRTLDLLDGCHEWKLRWATGVAPLADFDVFPASLPGRARAGVARATRAIRARVALALHGRPDPGRTAEGVPDPRHCRRLACPYAPPEPPDASSASKASASDDQAS